MTAEEVSGEHTDRKSPAEALVDLVEHHVNSERHALQLYEKFVTDKALSADMRFLVSMILGDEVRHHSYLQSLTASLRNEVEYQTNGSALPRVTWHVDAEKRAQWLNATEELLQIERDDIGELHKLRKELRPFSNETLWDLVISWMERDTQKHVDVLKFLRKHLKQLARESR